MIQSWIAYFKIFPDYSVHVEETFSLDNRVGLKGKAWSTCTKDGKLQKENYWEVPAAWREL